MLGLPSIRKVLHHELLFFLTLATFEPHLQFHLKSILSALVSLSQLSHSWVMISSTGEAYIQVSLPIFYLKWTFYSWPHLKTTVLSSRSLNHPHAVFWLHPDDNQNPTMDQYSSPPPDSLSICSFRATCSSPTVSSALP